MTSIGRYAPLLISHLADPALRALLLASAVTLVLRAARVRHPSLRLAVWTGMLYAALALPLLGLLLPPISVKAPAKPAAVVAAWLGHARASWQARLTPEQAVRMTAAPTAAAPQPSSLWTSVAASVTTSVSGGPADFASAGRGISRATSPTASMMKSSAERDGLRPGPTPGSMPSPALTKSTVPAALPKASPLARAVQTLTLREAAVLLYALVLVFFLVRLGIGLELSRRLRRRSLRVDDARALYWLRWHALAMGIDHAPALLESAAISVPLTLGVWRPAILLPSNWRAWENPKLSAVIAHELSHIGRKDSRTRALALVYKSFFWFSPLSWWLEGHLADLSEQASDLAALGAGAEPATYAEVLMNFFEATQNARGRVNWQGISMARGGRAQDRIERILCSKGVRPCRVRAPLLLLIALGAIPVVCVTAATRPVWVGASASAAVQTGDPQLPAPAPPAAPAVPTPPPSAPRAAAAGLGSMPGPAPLAPPPPRAAIASRTPEAPPAPPDPDALVPVTPPPAARLAQEPEPPEPPEAKAEDKAEDDENWTFNGTHEGMTFAIVSGKSVTMNGSGDDRDAVKALQKKIPGDFIWFIHNGNAYVIRDAATVQNAKRLYAPMDALGKQQEELGRQQEELGKQQEALGKRQEGVRVQVPAELEARLKKVEASIRELGPTASQEDLGRLQGELGDIQGYIGDLQGKAGDQQGELGKKQGELGGRQGELGRKQGEIGRQQGEIARAAARHMQDVLKQAVASGTAQRAPE